MQQESRNEQQQQKEPESIFQDITVFLECASGEE